MVAAMEVAPMSMVARTPGLAGETGPPRRTSS
jgi:hypothetical protein